MDCVTELIKCKPYREFLYCYFPKPVAQPTVRKKVNNPHPTITGCAFELFFKLLHSSKSNIEEVFPGEFSIAKENIRRLKSNIGSTTIYRVVDLPGNPFQQEGFIYLNKRSFDLIKDNFTTHLEQKHYSIDEKGLRIITIHRVLNHEAFKPIAQVLHAYDVNVFGTYALLDMESIASFFEKKIQNFINTANLFLHSKKFLLRFLESLLYFTQISSAYFDFKFLFKSMEFNPEYIQSTFSHFQSFKRRYTVGKGSLLYKPRLFQYGVDATPDLIVENGILELKASQKFFSSRDYLQTLSYFLFAQHPDNVKRYGKIETAGIYYSLYNETVNLDIDFTKLTKTFMKKWVSTIEMCKKGLYPAQPILKAKKRK